MHRRRCQHLVSEVQVRPGQRIRGALADRVGRAARERDPEQIVSQFADTAPRDPVGRGQRHQRRRQPQPERRAGDLRRQGGAGPRAAVPAAQLVCAMLAPGHGDRRQLDHLVATEPTARPLLLGREPSTTGAARIRVVIDDLIHLIRRLQLATSATVPRLSTLLAALTLFAHQLLRLRPRLRPPLRPRLGRIGARRLGTRPRVLTRRRLHTTQTLLHLPDSRSKIENELHTPRAPRRTSPPPQHVPRLQDSPHKRGIPATGPDD